MLWRNSTQSRIHTVMHFDFEIRLASGGYNAVLGLMGSVDDCEERKGVRFAEASRVEESIIVKWWRQRSKHGKEGATSELV